MTEVLCFMFHTVNDSLQCLWFHHNWARFKSFPESTLLRSALENTQLFDYVAHCLMVEAHELRKDDGIWANAGEEMLCFWNTGMKLHGERTKTELWLLRHTALHGRESLLEGIHVIAFGHTLYSFIPAAY